MLKITATEKKAILLNILLEIDSFCQNHGIQYFLTGGTLLGAIRHKGFIPWDDDIDICLFRKDYDLLVSSFSSTSGNIDVLTRNNKKNYHWSFAKAIDNRTVLIENGDVKSSIGVYVDIFPLDYVCGDYKQAIKYVKKVWFWRNALTLKHLTLDKNRSFIKNILVLIGKALYLIPDSFFLNKIDNLSTKYSKHSEAFFVCNFSGSWRCRELAKKECFSHSILCEFEKHLFSIPSGYDEYLNGVYGDYMILPPPEKQISHHSSLEYWKEK